VKSSVRCFLRKMCLFREQTVFPAVTSTCLQLFITVAQIIVFIRSTAAYCPIPNSERLLQSTHGSITYNRTANESVYCIWYLPISPSLPAVVIQIDYINVLHSTSYCKKTYCEGAQYCQKDSIRIKRGE